jgi:hypothetical protein
MKRCLEWKGERPKRNLVNGFIKDVGWEGYGLYKSKRRKTAASVAATKDQPVVPKRGGKLGDRMKEASRIYREAKSRGHPLTWRQAQSHVFGKGEKAIPKDKGKSSDLADEPPRKRKEPEALHQVPPPASKRQKAKSGTPAAAPATFREESYRNLVHGLTPSGRPPAKTKRGGLTAEDVEALKKKYERDFPSQTAAIKKQERM